MHQFCSRYAPKMRKFVIGHLPGARSLGQMTNDSFNMRQSEINFTVELDKDSVPDKIYWDATDNPNEGLNDTKGVSIAVWDHYHRNTLKIDLWTKDMEVGDMKQFMIEIMGGIASTVRSATGDVSMANDIDNLCRSLSKRVEEELKAENQK